MNPDMSVTTGIQRFGYYIPKPDGTMDFFVHDQVATADILTEFHGICSVIFNLQPILFSFDTVERNYSELVDSIKNHQLHMGNSVIVSAEPISTVIDGFALTSQKISNFLSATSAFLAQTETQLRRAHGVGSPTLEMWNEKRKYLYDNNFSYRFLYELRNFAQHCSLPFSRFDVAGERAFENASMLFNVNAMILRDGLFGVGFQWKKPVEAEIRKQPAEFELLRLIPEYFHILRQLCLEAIQLHRERLADCARYFDAVRRILKIPVGAVCVIFIGESASRDFPPSRFKSIPIEQFDYLIREYDKLHNACRPA